MKACASAELTLRGILLGIILAIILAASNTYLALKIGVLTSASIPAAVIAMSILRHFKNSNILENNLVQTCASAGEAIAGGVVYTIPALIIIHYADHFSYWHTFLIALIGGCLGILFSVPLRRVLIEDKKLHFPEAQAITKMLQIGMHDKSQSRLLVGGGLIGALLEFMQSGLQIAASHIEGFIKAGQTFFGFGTGFSATLIGAGYLIGFDTGLSLLIGAVSGYLIFMPVYTHFIHVPSAQAFISHQLRFTGIGSMLTAGIVTLLSLIKPIILGIMAPFKNTYLKSEKKDIPYNVVFAGILILSLMTYFLLNTILPFQVLGFLLPESIWISLLFILIIGFMFAAVCGYFSGMVGVSASPGSAIVIGGLLIVSFILRILIQAHHIEFTPAVITNACAIVIILISVVTGIACITNDNIQDLKVGQLIGSTPYKQQFMLFIGVIAAAAVVPLIMQLLFEVYGIGGVFPHTGMDASKMLPAPVPSVLAAVTQGVFKQSLPMNMLLIGACLTLGISILNYILGHFIKINFKLSILGLGMGLYLPLDSSTALFLGSLFAFLFKSSNGALAACGLVAGAALMDVLLAIPFAAAGNPNVLKILPIHGQFFALILGLVCLSGLAKMFHYLLQYNNFNKTP